jgi:hypothetical protein
MQLKVSGNIITVCKLFVQSLQGQWMVEAELIVIQKRSTTEGKDRMEVNIKDRI